MWLREEDQRVEGAQRRGTPIQLRRTGGPMDQIEAHRELGDVWGCGSRSCLDLRLLNEGPTRSALAKMGEFKDQVQVPSQC